MFAELGGTATWTLQGVVWQYTYPVLMLVTVAPVGLLVTDKVAAVDTGAVAVKVAVTSVVLPA
jgi:hypothetical protein